MNLADNAIILKFMRTLTLYNQNDCSHHMKFHLRIYDNYHYNDESEAYNTGLFDTYEDALQAAKGVVNQFLAYNWRKGMTPKDLHVLFLMYGDDPIVVPNERIENFVMPDFSARDYVQEIIEEFCSNLEEK